MIKLLTVKQIARMIVPLLKKNDVVKAGVFGSYVRGEAKARSDVDIVVKQKGKKSLLDFVRLERELEERLGRKVDLLTYKSVHPLIKHEILKTEVRIL